MNPQIMWSSATSMAMRACRTSVVAMLAATLTASAAPAPAADYDPPTKCDNCQEWNQPVAPFKIHGNTYYVGVQGVSSVLIATPQGLILLDGDLPQSAPLIEANIRTLGFRVQDIRFILNSPTTPAASPPCSATVVPKW